MTEIPSYYSQVLGVDIKSVSYLLLENFLTKPCGHVSASTKIAHPVQIYISGYWTN